MVCLSPPAAHRPRSPSPPAALVLGALLVLMAGSSLGCGDGGADETAPAGPNVLLLVVDTLRADHLGTYEPTVDFTPSLDAFAADALVFEVALAQGPDTVNSSASLLTSTWVSEHGYSDYQRAISPKHVTLAESMQRLGYDTFGVSTNPHVTRRNGMAQGFDEFLDILTWADTDASMVDRMFFQWLDERRSDRPFFALLWYVDPHTPYRPPQDEIDEVVPPELRHLVGERTWRPGFKALSDEEKRVTRLLYQAEVGYFDDQFADFVAELRRRGLYDEAVIAFTSDHGESFWEHVGVDDEPVVGHGISLFREETWVPLMLKLPGGGGRRIADPVRSIDLAPTLTALAGATADAPGPRRFRGRDLAALWRGTAGGPARSPSAPLVSELLTETGGEVRVRKESVREGDRKLIRTYVYRGVKYEPPVEWLLDGQDRRLDGDSAGPADRERLIRALEAWRARLRPLATTPLPTSENDEKLEERLRALGYL